MKPLLDRMPGIGEVRSGRRAGSYDLFTRLTDKAEVLRQIGVGPGTRVILNHGNSIDFFCDLLAIWSLRASVVLVHPACHVLELEEILNCTHAPVMITMQKRTLQSPCRVLHSVDDFPSGRATNVEPGWLFPEDECLILFSSGSTGRQKGICHSWRGLQLRLRSIQAQFGNSLPKKTLCLLPTSFGHGLIANSLAPWFAGSELLILEEFNPFTAGSLNQLIASERIEFFSTVPMIWKVLERTRATAPMPDLRHVFCASAPLDSHTREFMMQWCDRAETRNIYGLSEAASWVAGSRTPAAPLEGYIGEVWGAELSILHDERLIRDAHQPGEICLRGQSLMSSYLGAQTAPFFEGYFRTGDLGYLDDNGHLVLSGRLSDLINKGGVKISPAEIRQCLLGHPEVSDAWVTAVRDEFWGQVIGAVIVPRNPEDFTLRQLQEWSNDQLSSIKRISKWRIEPQELPKTPNGKTDLKRISLLLENSP